MKFIRQFLNVLAFLTILPLDKDERLGPEDFGRFPPMFPLVGLVIGLILFLFRFALEAPGIPPALIPILLVTLLIILTRGFHLDGLADTMDALLSHRSQEEKLKIMKDPHQGTFGVLAIILDVLLKTALLTSLIALPFHAGALILFPAWGRLSTTVVTTFCSYARPSGGLGQWMVDYSTSRGFFVGVGLTLLISLPFGLTAIASALFATLLGFALVLVWNKTLGGVTGDLLGSTTEISETCTLLFYLMLV
jgi:adenosylcobinamide-GDP ribazoletransferase